MANISLRQVATTLGFVQTEQGDEENCWGLHSICFLHYLHAIFLHPHPIRLPSGGGHIENLPRPKHVEPINLLRLKQGDVWCPEWEEEAQI